MPPNPITTENTYPQLEPAHTGAGAEPGINPRARGPSRQGHFREDCVIELADYSSDHVLVRRLGNDELVQMLRSGEETLVDVNEGEGSGLGADIDISTGCRKCRTCVRWINIGGVDWDVMSAVALKYNLHALALEDVLHEQGHNLSKADYYHEHLFIRILSHTLIQNSDKFTSNPTPNAKQKLSPSSMDSALERGQLAEAAAFTSSTSFNKHDSMFRPKTTAYHLPDQTPLASHGLNRRLTGLSGFHAPARLEQLIKIRALTKGDHLNVLQEPLFIFLTRNGSTVISIRPTPSLDFTAPISERLHNPDSVLRTSEDASLLVESLLDLVVDRVLEVTDAYQDRILKLEHDVLRRHGTSIVRSLHVLSGDIILHRRMLEPIKTMIYGLRRYDLDRCIALADNMEAEAETEGPWVGTENRSVVSRNRPPHRNEHGMGVEVGETEIEGKTGKVKGYLSYKTKVYLADVYDHMDYALASLDMFSGISENLLNYAFNMASYEMNEVMRRLTLATIIFLPLTILTGYFGMNFHPFPAVDDHSDLLFWKIALPAMAALVPVFMMLDIRSVVGNVQKWVSER